MRILIELPTWLGDAVMASAAVEAIAKHAAAFDAGNQARKFSGSASKILSEAKPDGRNLDAKPWFSSASADDVTGDFTDDSKPGAANKSAGESGEQNLTSDGGADDGDVFFRNGKFDGENWAGAGNRRADKDETVALDNGSEANFSFLSQNFGAVTQERQIFTDEILASDEANLGGESNDKFDGVNLAASAQNSALNGQKFSELVFKNSKLKNKQATQNLKSCLKISAEENQNPQNLKKEAREPVKIVFFGSFAACELFKAHPNCERVIVDSSKKAKFRLWRLFWQARNLGKFDAAFSFRSSFASKVLLYGARAERKFAFKKSKDGAHQVQKYLKFVKSALNLKRADDELKLYFEPRKFDAPVLGLNPGASYGSAKRWYPAYFAQVALHFKDKFKIMIFGGAGERDMCEQIEQILRQNGVECLNLAGKTSVKELCENIGGIGQSGGIFVTNDSGPMHIAAAYKTPTIALFGPTRFTQTCPWRNENARILHLNLECMPCMKRVCPLGTHECMKNLTPQTVCDEIEKLEKSAPADFG